MKRFVLDSPFIAPLFWAFVVLAITACLVYGVLAQQPAQPPFVPYTITEQQHKQVMDYLGEVPAKWANPLINTLAGIEQAAQATETAKNKGGAGQDKDKVAQPEERQGPPAK